MRRIGIIIIKLWIPLVIAVLVLSAFFVLNLSKIEMRDDESTWMAKGSPTKVNYDHFKELFGSDEFVIVAYDSPDPFQKSEIAYLTYLTKELELIQYIDEVTSLTNIEDTSGSSGSSRTRPFLRERDAPDNEVERSILESKISSNPFIKGTLISGDFQTLGIIMKLETSIANYEVNRDVTNSIENILADEYKLTGRQFYFAGGPVSDAKMNDIMQDDLALFTPLSLIISGIILLIVFRRWQCVLFPLITVILGMLWTFGMKAIVGSPVTQISATLVALITIIGVANSVHFIDHYRIEFFRCSSKREALIATFAKAGTPCFLTSLTTAVGFSSLTISNIPLIRNMGMFASFGIMTTFVLSMILVPIGLRLVKSFSVPARRSNRTWESIGKFTVHNSMLLIIAGIIITIGMALGGLKIQIEASMMNYMKEDSQIRQSANFLDDNLAGSSTMELIVTGKPDSFKSAVAIRNIERLQRVIENYTGVAGSLSIVDHIKMMNTAFYGYTGIPGKQQNIDAIFRYFERSDDLDIDDYYREGDYDTARVSIKTKQMSREEREKIINAVNDYADTNMKQFDIVVSGINGMFWSVTTDIINTQIYSLSITVFVILILMGFFFGIRGALASILPNILPITVLFGIMGLAGFKLNIATITVAAICIGLVVDDTIHYFAHFRRLVIDTKDREQAAIDALKEVGNALLFTAIILSLGFSIIMISESAFLVEFGILAVIALVVAFVADIIVSPALLTRLNVFKQKKQDN